jgi:hypothetical protein
MKPNKWIAFVKEYSKKHNISFGCAITQQSVRDAYYGKTTTTTPANNTTPDKPVEKQKKRITPTLLTSTSQSSSFTTPQPISSNSDTTTPKTTTTTKSNKTTTTLNPDTQFELISQYISQDKPFKTTRKLTKQEISELARMQLSNTFRRQELTQSDKDFILKNKSKYDEEWLKSRGLVNGSGCDCKKNKKKSKNKTAKGLIH